MVEQVRAKFEKVDILFVNAGVFFGEPVGQITERTFDQVMGINFKGALFTTEKFLPLISDGGSIINLSSVSAFAVAPGTAIYAASKAALNSYTRSAAIELAARSIRVNVISPGMVATGLSAKSGMSEKIVSEMNTHFETKIPLKRFGQPEEIAKLAAFLASDDASFITGAEYIIDGGATVNEPFR